MPPAVSGELTNKCRKANPTANECESLTCVFRESNLMDGTAVNKEKTRTFLDNYVREHPVWSPAIEHAKAACLGPVELKPQGIHLNCPIYDIMHCIFASMIKNATPAQWSSTSECQGYRSFAAACPYCPADCFAAQVPIGSCNACLSLPRSP
uniref:Odorant binding protein n=1 Tax=Heliothis virescens TaxID=7102 RepID=A0A2A4J0D2_HELVI